MRVCWGRVGGVLVAWLAVCRGRGWRCIRRGVMGVLEYGYGCVGRGVMGLFGDGLWVCWSMVMCVGALLGVCWGRGYGFVGGVVMVLLGAC